MFLIGKFSAISSSFNGAPNLMAKTVLVTDSKSDIGKATVTLWKTVLAIQRFATVTEIAEAAYFLAHAEYATGNCLSIDGGNTAGGSL